MPDLDRARLIDLLGRLGAPDDAAVIAAARDLERLVRDAGTTWDALLRSDFEAAAPSDHQPAPADGGADGAVSAAEMAEAGRLIERLLARSGLSTETREDLEEMQRTIAAGRFDAMDNRYVRALARRLGA